MLILIIVSVFCSRMPAIWERCSRWFRRPRALHRHVCASATSALGTSDHTTVGALAQHPSTTLLPSRWRIGSRIHCVLCRRHRPRRRTPTSNLRAVRPSHCVSRHQRRFHIIRSDNRSSTWGRHSAGLRHRQLQINIRGRPKRAIQRPWQPQLCGTDPAGTWQQHW